MRRLVSNVVVLLLLAGILAPAALASFANAHGCCLRAQHESCSAPAGFGFHSTAENCRSCCPGLVLAPHRVLRPQSQWAVPASIDSHPFVSEFYPAVDSHNELTREAQRAPPAVSSRP